MLVKKCDKCFRLSYSQTDAGKWICPHEDCKEDITHVKAEVPSKDDKRG